MLVGVLAGENPVSGTFPVATLVICGGRVRVTNPSKARK
jgi:hypothetical protein